MKQVISVVLTITMLLALIPTISFATMGDYGGNETGATWYWPIHGYSSASSAYSKITSSYGYRGGSYKSYHKGIDIGEGNGTAIYPVRKGTVSKIHNSTSGSYGRYIVINHNDGYFSIYMHLSRIDVSKEGESVGVNTQIGAVGASGYGYEKYPDYGYHLHMGIHYGSSFPSNFECNVNPCPSGYTRIGNSMQESAGGRPIGTATISYSVNPEIETPPDTEAPKFDFHGVDDNITISGTYKFWWKQTGYSNCDVNVYINDSHLDTIYPDAGGFFSYNLDSTQYGNGGYTIKAILRDSSGAEKTVTRNITINNPKFDFHGVDDNITVSGTYKFWWKQTGYCDCELKLYIDGGYIGILYPDDGGYFSYLFDSAQYTNEKHIIEAVLYNSAGQQKYVYRNFNIYNKKSEFKGWTESCTGGAGTITVCGWVYDELNPSIPVDIHIYIGGPVGTEAVEIHTFSANQYRPDVNSAYGVGDNHGFLQTISVKKIGEQQICVYAVNPYTNEVITFGEFSINITPDTLAPTISNLRITNVTKTGYTVSCTFDDNVMVEKVEFPTWTTKDGQDDIIWHSGIINGNTAYYTVNINEHGNQYGEYETHVYVYDVQGNCAGLAIGKAIVYNYSFVKSQVKVNEASFNITSNVYNIEDGYTIIVAGYKSNRLVDVIQTTQGVSAIINGDIDEIKVMAWNNLSELRPLCEAEVIPSSEFIIE